jgi:hypothetical protein
MSASPRRASALRHGLSFSGSEDVIFVTAATDA